VNWAAGFKTSFNASRRDVLSCRLLYVKDPTLDGCKGECSSMYYYNVSVGYSDISEIAKFEVFYCFQSIILLVLSSVLTAVRLDCTSVR